MTATDDKEAAMPTAASPGPHPVHELVRDRYAASALGVTQGGSACCGPTDVEIGPGFGAALYGQNDRDGLPDTAVSASLGCGNPTAIADLQPGQRVLDLGSGGGIDVLLSARRVGPDGFVYGLDMTEEMLDLARRNAEQAGATNVEFLHGTIEQIPLPDGCIDVVISNCVVNLSPDKSAVVAQTYRVLAPGGRLGLSDVVAEDSLTPEERAERGSWVGCIAGALSIGELDTLLTSAGFSDVDIATTHEVAPGMHAAIIRATKPARAPRPSVRVFEPALCCASGICGPDVDESLFGFTADLAHLTGRGADIVRHNLASEPLAFAGDPAVREFLESTGSEGLPLTTVDGAVALSGRYPSRDELMHLAGLAQAPTTQVVPDGTSLLATAGEDAECCAGTGCC